MFGAVSVAAVLVAGAAQAALEDRDLDGDTVVDAFYDTDLDITWLRNANVNGQQTWADSVAWADGYSFGGYSDWRLPTSDTCIGFNCTGSEMGHLWYVELGNSSGAMTNTGNFQNFPNLPTVDYWNGTEYAPDSCCAWQFRTSTGLQTTEFKADVLFAMAVTNGDVGMVPEPETYALMLAGLAGLSVTRWQRRR